MNLASVRLVSALAAGVLLLAGCGYKDDLVLPPAELPPPPETMPAEETTPPEPMPDQAGPRR